ncbi:GMC oxidoreductase [Sphingobacterium chungjuense]|uniref:GMC oxidoreductase n=1 Tax=Sphingobacterium chungjuense TaxID=2675553 RepID=UPI00140937B2|nr:GMC family oxidoreductase [Sphingobacterium chungjuense]
MANIGGETRKERTFDVIVIGSGASGGWAAKEFTEKGLKTLVLERGRDVVHVKDYPTTNLYPYELEHKGEITYADKQENPVANRCYAYKEDTKHFFASDAAHPYIQDKEFDWIRGYQVGGKSLLWARQTQRWSEYDFEGPARDGFAVDWPIRYADIAPWYDHVERFVGIAGNKDGLDTLPDGDFLPAYPLNAVEDYFKKTVQQHYGSTRHVISARCAHLSEPKPIHIEQGRVKCQHRILCQRGCPFGGYFSSNSSTLPWAMKTGNLTLRPFSTVHSILYDQDQEKAVGVKVIDTDSGEEIDFFAKVIFVNASTLNTNQILMNSISARFPNGLGNDNGLLGQYIAFHNYTARITASYDGLQEYRTDGRNPAGGGYIPNFRNVHRQETDFLRGWAATFGASRQIIRNNDAVGEELKSNLTTGEWSNWKVHSHMMAETIPKEENRVWLDEKQTDKWGIPLLHISVEYAADDGQRRSDYYEHMADMFEKAGFQDIRTQDDGRRPGNDIHEMGGARMGHDPKTSLLNKWNQLHLCKNVYVTDGACMTSTATQNPTLTYMALTARAVDHAVSELKKRNL